MTWIKNNPFLVGLIGITVLICAALLFFGIMARGKYNEAKVGFEESYQAVSTSEGIPLYPTAENRDGKRKALVEYGQEIDDLRTLFDDYRPKTFDKVSSQAFTDRVKTASAEVAAALEAAGSELPTDFFLGFEQYRNQLAQSEATGILIYQLVGIKHAMMGLAEAKPSELISIYREPVPEETGLSYEPGETDVARNFGFEVVFRGSENSARKFISSLGETVPYYYIVRSVAIKNSKDIPPNVKDAKFESALVAKEAKVPDNPFGAAFGLPGADPAGEEGVLTAETVAAPSAEAPADSSRILAQVLGGEEVLVFVRFDLTMFLPSKELPKP